MLSFERCYFSKFRVNYSVIARQYFRYFRDVVSMGLLFLTLVDLLLVVIL
jgi:hypothetical protein